MARTALPIQQIPRNGSIAGVSFTAADATNDHEFPNDGNTFLIVKNTDVAAQSVTVVSVPDEHGRTGDLTISVPANGGVAVTSVFRPAIWNQSGADAGKVFVNITTATGLSLAAVRLPG